MSKSSTELEAGHDARRFGHTDARETGDLLGMRRAEAPKVTKLGEEDGCKVVRAGPSCAAAEL